MGLENTGFTLANDEVLWIDPLDYQQDLAKAVTILSAAGVRVSIYNLPRCVLAPSTWGYAAQSISDWKNAFLKECEGCSDAHVAAGFLPREGPNTVGRSRQSGPSKYQQVSRKRVWQRREEHWEVSAVGAPNIGERSEKEIISAFVNRIADLSPQLVTFNGSSFDLPVLRYRAMVCGVAARAWRCARTSIATRKTPLTSATCWPPSARRTRHRA